MKVGISLNYEFESLPIDFEGSWYKTIQSGVCKSGFFYILITTGNQRKATRLRVKGPPSF